MVMTTLDELVVRLDADIRPFCRSLEAADKKLKTFENRSAKTLNIPRAPVTVADNSDRTGGSSHAETIEVAASIQDLQDSFNALKRAFGIAEEFLPQNPLSDAQLDFLRDRIAVGRDPAVVEDLIGRSLGKLNELSRMLDEGTLIDQFERAARFQQEAEVVDRATDFRWRLCEGYEGN